MNSVDIAASGPDNLPRASRSLYVRRRIVSALGWSICAVCFVILAYALVNILYEIAKGGFPALSLDLFTTPTQGVSGGLLNAIEGTVVITLGSVLIATPLGVGIGAYVAEFRDRRFAAWVRFIADVLVGVPSIVLGLFGYISMVVWLGWHFSVLAGSITLAVMITPYIARTTEMALIDVSSGIREAAYAVGAGRSSVLLRILIPACAPRILTGVLLAMALSMGETAPLIYTVGWSNYLWHGHLTHEPIGYLTYVIWSFINEPFESAHQLAFAAALLITFFALVITLSSRLILNRLNARK